MMILNYFKHQRVLMSKIEYIMKSKTLEWKFKIIKSKADKSIKLGLR